MSDNTALAIVPADFTTSQLDIITNQIAKGASKEDLAFFLEVCKMTGLNPFQRQIYAVMRNGKSQKLPSGEWHTPKVMTIQTGIDGYRLIAARSGTLAGIDDPIYDTEDAEHPNKATVTVWRFTHGQRVPFTASARWNEYVQEKDVYEKGEKTGKKALGDMWAKMPFLMLGKCAESLALRKAFPAELSGVYTREEMSQADSDHEPEPTPPAARQQPPRRVEVVDTTEVYDATPVEATAHKDATTAQLDSIRMACKSLNRDMPVVTSFDHAKVLLEELRAAWREAKKAENAAKVAQAEQSDFDLRTLPAGELAS